jgi:hypothetical protein
MNNKLAVIEEEQEQEDECQDPLSIFMYALKAPETR